MQIIKVKNPQEGIQKCKELLYELVSKNTVLFLSGGSTPKVLYQQLAKEKKLSAGAVAMVDERFIQNHESRIKNHGLPEGTNQLMIERTGLVRYLEKSKTRFYSILENKKMEETAKDYDETVRYLFNYFQKSVAILGVGIDGHTAGLPARRIKNLELRIQKETDLVTFFTDFPGAQKERITLTFLSLSKLDKIIVLVFGKDKQKALQQMFTHSAGSGQESIAKIPSRFLTQKEIAGKVVLITDQKI